MNPILGWKTDFHVKTLRDLLKYKFSILNPVSHFVALSDWLRIGLVGFHWGAIRLLTSVCWMLLPHRCLFCNNNTFHASLIGEIAGKNLHMLNALYILLMRLWISQMSRIRIGERRLYLLQLHRRCLFCNNNTFHASLIGETAVRNQHGDKFWPNRPIVIELNDRAQMLWIVQWGVTMCNEPWPNAIEDSNLTEKKIDLPWKWIFSEKKLKNKQIVFNFQKLFIALWDHRRCYQDVINVVCNFKSL